ncbi:MAG: 3'-5' exonuclease [Treponema sp.]|jgi:DNA polymerase-3 subunit epsilon|nr:3'-5' exonuclease [Treponema sp.]
MDFIALDFETACYKQESACSVGLLKYLDGKEADSFYSLIRPPRLYIRPDFTEIHGLTVNDVRDAPNFAQLWEDIYAFIGCLPLAAHNAMFDMGVLKAVLDKYAIPVPPIHYFCTLALARKTWPRLKSHALTALAKHFGIVYKAHNALDDARTCGKLVLMSAQQCVDGNNLKKLLKKTGIRMKSL